MKHEYHPSHGRTSNLTKTDFLIQIFREQRIRKFSDEKIEAIFKKEFPWCASLDYSARISTIRNQFNRGALPGQTFVPKLPVLRYDSEGKPFPQRRGPAPRALIKRKD
jgi:hypothetical protein